LLRQPLQAARNAPPLTVCDDHIHLVANMFLFMTWMLFIERSPWPTLPLIVSLEASAFQQAKADHEFNNAELELKTNTELTRAIHAMTTELRQRVMGESNQ